MCIFIFFYIHIHTHITAKIWISFKFNVNKSKGNQKLPPVQARGPEVVSPSLTALSATNGDATRSKSVMANFC